MLRLPNSFKTFSSLTKLYVKDNDVTNFYHLAESDKLKRSFYRIYAKRVFYHTTLYFGCQICKLNSKLKHGCNKCAYIGFKHAFKNRRHSNATMNEPNSFFAFMINEAYKVLQFYNK